jgi:hypothetical protein
MIWEVLLTARLVVYYPVKLLHFTLYRFAALLSPSLLKMVTIRSDLQPGCLADRQLDA